MLSHRRLARLVLACEAVGFLIPITVVWLDEVVDLPHRLFDAPASPMRLGECALESALIAAAALGVMIVTWRLFREVARARRAAEVLTCSCCARIQWRGEWLDVQEFAEEVAQRHADYGMCPHCQRRIATEILPANAAPRI